MGADDTRARKGPARRGGWAAAALGLMAGAILATGACNSPLKFSSGDAGPSSSGVGGAGGAGGSALGGVGGTDGFATGGRGGSGSGGSGIGGSGTGGTGSGGSSTGGSGVGGSGSGGSGTGGSTVDSGQDIRPDVRDTGVDVGLPIVCTSNAQCKLGLVCLTSESRCVECNANTDCMNRAVGSVCDTGDHRCVECNAATVATDCPPVVAAGGESKPSQCSVNHHCLSGCDDSFTTVCPPFKPGAPSLNCMSFSGGVSLCAACSVSTQCTTAANQTCTPDHTCISCTSNTGCTSTPGTPICDTVFTGRCVQCTSSLNCTGNPNGPICDPATLTCVPVP